MVIKGVYKCLYNKNSGEHFYTAKAGERDDLVKIGWQYEGIGWYAPETSETPVYRLYNKYGGEHHYTVNEAEKDALVKAGWTDEDIGWYSDDNKTVVLYREYNPNARSCNHNYTTNQKEHETLIGIGWNDEGTAWYGIKEGAPAAPAPTPEPGGTVYKESDRHNWGFGVIPDIFKDIEEFKHHFLDSENRLPYWYGTDEALKAAKLAGTDPELAKLPCFGFMDENGAYILDTEP